MWKIEHLGYSISREDDVGSCGTVFIESEEETTDLIEVLKLIERNWGYKENLIKEE